MSVLSLAEVGNRWHSGLGDCDEKWYNEEYVENLEEQIVDAKKELKEKSIEYANLVAATYHELELSQNKIEAVEKILDEVPVYPNRETLRRGLECIREELQK